MDSQFKAPAFDGTQAPSAGARPYSFQRSLNSPPDPYRLPSQVLRGIAAVLLFISAILMGAANQTKDYTIVDASTGTSESGTGTVKSIYSSAFVYFIVINVLAFVYTVFALAMSVTGRDSWLELPLSMADVVTLVLLFSANGGAATTSIIAERGQPQLAWHRICHIVGTFCAQFNWAIVLSFIASFAYFGLVLLAILSLHKRSL